MSHSRATVGMGKAPHQLQKAAPFQSFAAAFFHHRRNRLKKTHLTMLEQADTRIFVH